MESVFVAKRSREKDKQQREYYLKKNTSLLEDYLAQELQTKERVIFENKDFVALTPFWAIWPFEVMIAPKKWKKNILELSTIEVKNYAEAISVITKAYDKLFNTSFPYSSGIHQSTNK